MNQQGRLALKTLAVIVVALAAPFAMSRAAYVGTTDNGGNSLAAAPVFAQPAFRVTTYELQGFAGTVFDLNLNHDLAADYFVMINGGSGIDTAMGADADFVRVVADPAGTGALATSGSSRVLRLQRNAAVGDWSGSVAVVEALGGQATSAFALVDVVSVTLSGTATGGTATSNPWSDINRVVPFGGIRGGGVQVSSGAASAHASGFGRIYPSGVDTIAVVRDLTGAGAATATHTVYVVEFGAEWNVQHVIVSGSAGGNGADATGEYNTAAIAAVNRDDTFVIGWGHTDDGGIGDAFGGTLIALGDGVSQNTTESLVAVGQEYSDNRTVDVYVLEHTDAAVDHRFKSDGNSTANSYGHAVDAALGAESYTTADFLGVVAAAGMNGGNGGWPVLFGDLPVTTTMETAISEDTLMDAEQNHIGEQVGYLAFESSNSFDIRSASGTVIGEAGRVPSVGTGFQFVALRNSYTNPVVVAAYDQSGASNTPAVVRVRNAAGVGFEVRIQNPGDGSTPASRPVHYVVLEAGAHTLPGAIPIEAGTVTVAGTNHDADWSSSQQQAITPASSFTSPVVLGQVMTQNDALWSVFWASDGNQGNPPSAGAIYVGKHVAEDPVVARGAETIGYIVVEAGSGTTGGVGWDAAVSGGSVQGLGDAPPYSIPLAIEGGIWTEGSRFGIQYNGSNGTGTAYPRPLWGVRHTGSVVLTAFRMYQGQAWPAWVQSVDLSQIEY